jgi:hypothetical protein
MIFGRPNSRPESSNCAPGIKPMRGRPARGAPHDKMMEALHGPVGRDKPEAGVHHGAFPVSTAPTAPEGALRYGADLEPPEKRRPDHQGDSGNDEYNARHACNAGSPAPLFTRTIFPGHPMRSRCMAPQQANPLRSRQFLQCPVRRCSSVSSKRNRDNRDRDNWAVLTGSTVCCLRLAPELCERRRERPAGEAEHDHDIRRRGTSDNRNCVYGRSAVVARAPK